MNMQQYKAEFTRLKLSEEQIESTLEDTTARILFLQSIYETGGVNNFYSDHFQHAALIERDELCQLTSACHSLLREAKP